MEGDISDLLHLGDLVSIEDTSTALSVAGVVDPNLVRMKVTDPEICQLNRLWLRMI